MSEMVLPEGFRPHTFASLVARFLRTSPYLAKDLAKIANPEIDTDTDLGPGVETLHRLEDKELIQFAENPDGEPAVLVGPRHAFIAHGETPDIGDGLVRYFDRSGSYDPQTGQLTEEIGFNEWAAQYPLAVRHIAEQARLSRRIVEETLRGWAERGIVKFATMEGQRGASEKFNRSEMAIWMALRPVEVDEHGRRKPKEIYQHLSYMRAVEAQYAALSYLEETRDIASLKHIELMTRVTTADLWGDDINCLKAADTYCWFAEPLHAVDVAAATVPPSTVLHRDMTESATGWWFFMEPYPLKTTTHTDAIVALLWGWTVKGNVSGVRFSVYVSNETHDGKPSPSTLFFWPEGMSLEQMISVHRETYRQRYGDGNEFAEELNDRDRQGVLGMELLGLDDTMYVIEQLARLFIAGAIWIEQKILVYTPGSVERHDRKRLARAGMQRSLSDVQVIELRRRHTVPMNDHPAGNRHVDWRCRWIVRGHFREQWYPSKGEHRTKFIEAYPKGPENRPLKVPTHTIFKVER